MRSNRPRPGHVLVALGFALTATLAAQTPQTAAPQSAAAASANLPAARQIVDRHLEAIGGRVALLAHSSSHTTGSVQIPGAGMTGTFEAFAAKPDKMLVRMSLGGIGETQEGFNGTIGWSINSMTGPTVLQGKELSEKKFDADFYGELTGERYDSMTTVERTTFDGRPCYKVRLVRKGGGEDFAFYDVATGLKAGSITSRESPMGTVTPTTIETDYKKFGNLMQPTMIKMSVMGVETVMTVSSVEYDKVDASVFEPPAAIKALAK